MPLRTSTVYSKALAMFVALMLLLGAAVVSLTQFIIAREFQRAEERDAEQKMRGAKFLMDRELSILRKSLDEPAEDALEKASPDALDFEVVASPDGRILEMHGAGGGDLQAASELLVPLLGGRAPAEGESYAVAKGRLHAIAWRREPRGNLLLAARDLSEDAATIGRVLGGQVAFLPMPQISIGSPGTEDLAEMISMGSVTFVRGAPDELTARSILRGPDRSILGLLGFTQVIPPERSGQGAVRVFLTVLVLAGGVFFGLVWYLLDRTILLRVRELTRQVE
ncbi:MAG: hypothetical protein N2322_04255, partial [Terrimicrobiaceae bacterium]|nr:hypothetical protein [Terrimicrobiaceae bacterium]